MSKSLFMLWYSDSMRVTKCVQAYKSLKGAKNQIKKFKEQYPGELRLGDRFVIYTDKIGIPFWAEGKIVYEEVISNV